MGWIITFLILFALAILPLGASVRYDADGLQIRIIGGPVRLTIYPFPKRKKKVKKTKEKTPPANPSVKTEIPPQKKPKGGSLMDFLPLLQLAIEFFCAFRKKLRVNHLEMKIIMAGGDPCDLAINYGRAWAALGNLLPMLERVFVIQKRDLEVECDFTSDQTLINARLDITITLGRILSLVAVYGFRGAITFLKIMKKRKGGAAK